MKRALVPLSLWLAWSGVGLSQPRSTPTPTPTADRVQLQDAVDHALGEEDESHPPSAKDTNRPAIFGSMIASRLHEKAGTSIYRIQLDSRFPWGVSLLLLPIYLVVARRRGFRIKEERS
ncbi:hypothetical protein IV102_34110 [bacterium]|nr:hypothetical protein [bacterium]